MSLNSMSIDKRSFDLNHLEEPKREFQKYCVGNLLSIIELKIVTLFVGNSFSQKMLRFERNQDEIYSDPFFFRVFQKMLLTKPQYLRMNLKS